MDSAAYWLGSSANYVYATKSADVGSIGVYMAFMDLGRMAENMGIKVDVISSGKYKGAGIPGTSLSEAQRELFQKRVKDLSTDFQEHVSNMRDKLVDMDAMQGQSFSATNALSAHLIDGIVACRDDIVEKLKRKKR